MDSIYPTAVETQIEQAELGGLPTDNWDDYPWVDDITYVPTEQEQDEMFEMFSPLARVEEWITNLDDRSYFEAARALRVLREFLNKYNAEVVYSPQDSITMGDFIELL